MNRARYLGLVTDHVAPPVGALFAERLRYLRKLRGLSILELAEKCKDAGMPELTEASLVNLERPTKAARPRRRASLDEALVLAAVLEVPPGRLWFDVEKGEPVEIANRAVDPWLAIRWISGEVTLDGQSTATDPLAAPLVLNRKHDDLEETYRAAYQQLHYRDDERVKVDAPGARPMDETEKDAFQRMQEVMVALVALRVEMRRSGVTPPTVRFKHLADWLKRVEEAGDHG